MNPAATDRLARLDRFLRQDPGNATLLADAFEAALAAGDPQRASRYLEVADRLALDSPAWTSRKAHLCIARRELAEAATLLQALASRHDHPALAHDRAWVAFLQEDFGRCRELLTPWLATAGEHQEPVQVLWLRATHRLGRLREGWDWARSAQEESGLQPLACGVASLLAVDADAFGAVQPLAEVALAADPRQPEALLALATLALARRHGARAEELLQAVLRTQPDDGRTWAMLGFASLQAHALAPAQERFERALAAMPLHIGTWHGLGWTCLLRQDAPCALAAFEQALALDRNFAESHGAIGLVLALQGRQAEAAPHLERAERLDRRNVTGRFARALLQGQAGDVQALRKLAARLLDRPGFFGEPLHQSVREAMPQG